MGAEQEWRRLSMALGMDGTYERTMQIAKNHGLPVLQAPQNEKSGYYKAFERAVNNMNEAWGKKDLEAYKRHKSEAKQYCGA